MERTLETVSKPPDAFFKGDVADFVVENDGFLNSHRLHSFTGLFAGDFVLLSDVHQTAELSEHVQARVNGNSKLVRDASQNANRDRVIASVVALYGTRSLKMSLPTISRTGQAIRRPAASKPARMSRLIASLTLRMPWVP